MKYEHKIELGGRELTLSLTFSTTMTLMEKVGSPSEMFQDFVDAHTARELGRPFNGTYKLNERLAVQILCIGNAPHEGLSFDEIGALAAEEGFIRIYTEVVEYLQFMIGGKSATLEEAADEARKEGEDLSGN